MFRAEVRGQETFSVVSMVLRSTLGVGTHGHDGRQRKKKNNKIDSIIDREEEEEESEL